MASLTGEPGARLTGELAAARIVDLPLRGEWVAIQTPGTRIPSHGTDMLGQRFALDFMRLDRRGGGRFHRAGVLRTLVAGVPTSECYGWGEPVHAMLAGEVVAASDGAPERRMVRPVMELLRVARTAATFRTERLGEVLGNHVVIRHGDTWSGYVHLAPDSLAVSVGQAVGAGDVIGRVGHTGNSTSPHLHVQLMDSPDPLRANGLPCAFRAAEVEGPGGWVRCEPYLPVALERFRSVEPSGGGR
jgi:murein DD-endopeptidase MepM/ murein hydrolase activator NlpD